MRQRKKPILIIILWTHEKQESRELKESGLLKKILLILYLVHWAAEIKSYLVLAYARKGNAIKPWESSVYIKVSLDGWLWGCSDDFTKSCLQ